MLLRTLGALELHDAVFTRPKPLLLLAYLALEGPQPRRYLAELFWPGAVDRMKSLAVALSRLRRGAPGAIDADRQRVWARVTTDAERLLEELERGDVGAAMDLYQHPFLEGVEVSEIGIELEEWVYSTRELLAGRLRRELLAVSEEAARRGEYGTARSHAEAAHGLRGAAVLAPEDLLRLYTLLRATGSKLADEVGAEAATFDLDLATTESEARGRLLGDVELPEEASAANGSRFGARRLEQHIGFITSGDGARIAYATIGNGPPLVKAANWLSHLDHDWDSSVWRHWLDALSRYHTLVRYDERGCGLSDRDVELSLDAFVRDLEVLVDTLGIERFPLLGMSQGASVSLAYAVRHPERVTHLILVGSYIEPEPEDEANAMLEMIRIGWGRDNDAFRQAFTTLFMPDATPDQMRCFNDMQRSSASPEQAVALARTIFGIDARQLAPLVRVPTLIVHARGDAVVPFDVSRRLAASIPGARFLPLESDNHILVETEPAWPRFVEEVERFVVPAGRVGAGATSVAANRPAR